MAARCSYGETLREAREKRGSDIASMARKLHIRPDILKAIEEADFERMPARGYTRNMVRSYANTLGLDSSLITDMYLDEVHAYETGRPPSKGYSANGYNSYIRHRETGGFRDSSRFDRESEPSSPLREGYLNGNRRSVSLNDDYSDLISSSFSNSQRIRGASDNMRDAQKRQSPRRSNSAGSMKKNVRSRQANSRNLEEKDMAPKNLIGDFYANNSRKQGVSRGYQSVYSRHSQNGIMEKLPFLGIVAVVAVIVIIVLVVLFNGSKQSADNIPNIPISGLTDTSNPEGQINSNITEVAPTEAIFRYAVDDGAQSWIEIYENGSESPIFAGVVEGPAEEEIKVNGRLIFKSANPTPVHVAVDGKALELKKEEDSAYYICEVEFAKILDEWKKEHPTINISSSSSTSSTSSSSKSV